MNLSNYLIKNLKFSRKGNGFTLIELLIVIAIITALGITVFAALNPASRIASANDDRRLSDADTILTAIHQSIVDNKGTLPTNLAALSANTETQLGTGNAAACSPITTGGCNIPTNTVACVDLMSGAQNLSTYLKTMPFDPVSGAAGSTKYTVTVDTNKIVTIKACGVQGSTNISVSR